jgi:hypothetical protein
MRMNKWLFHVGANLIEKKKLLRKLYGPALKIYTNEIAMICKHQQIMKIITGSWLFHLTT